MINAQTTVDAPAVAHQSNSLDWYLDQIGQIPLLSIQDEIALAKQIKRGSNQAFQQLVKSNLRLVVVIARDFQNLGLSMEEMISHGNEGLMTAARKFQPGKGAKFSTYAALWIKQSVRRALSDTSRTIRIPVHITEKLYKIYRATNTLLISTGEMPDDEQIAKHLGLKTQEIQRLRDFKYSMLNLDAPANEDEHGGVTFNDIIEDVKTATPFEHMEFQDSRRFIREIVQKLRERDALIITLRFGLNGKQPLTLESVARRLKISRERVRQVQDEVLMKLKVMIEEADCDFSKAA